MSNCKVIVGMSVCERIGDGVGGLCHVRTIPERPIDVRERIKVCNEQ